MIGVYEILVLPDAVKANVCPKTISMAVVSAAKRQNARAEVSQLPSPGDSRLWGSRWAPEAVVFIQVSMSASGLGSGQC